MGVGSGRLSVPSMSNFVATNAFLLIDALVKPTVSCGCEVWGKLCSWVLQPELKGKKIGFQVAFPPDVQDQKGVPPHLWVFVSWLRSHGRGLGGIRS